MFCHLFIGAVLGLLLYRWSGQRWIVPVVAFGAILPDLIDKPLGHLLLNSTLDSGRIFGHTMLFLLVLALAGAVLWKVRSSRLVGMVGLGVASHLVLDSMWSQPVTLLWPALGPFQQHHYPDYFANSLATELTTPSEWAFGILFASILIMHYREQLGHLGVWASRNLEPLQLPMLVFLMVIGAMTLASGLMTSFADWDSGQNMIIVGLCALGGGGFLMKKEMRRPLNWTQAD